MYYLVYGFLYSLSLLPLRILYLLSDFAFLLMYHVFGYRKKVVMHNLSIAFPEKTDQERKKIAFKFYRQLTDTFIETIKLISMSENEFKKRLTTNAEVINDIYASGQPVQLHSGHFFNWEFLNLGTAYNCNYPFLGIYHDVSNKTMDRIMRKMRSKFGTILIPSHEFRHKFKSYTQQPYLLGLVADQSPSNPKQAYWIDFFGVKTAFVTGPEKGARQMNTAIVMANIYRKKRGYYHMQLSLLTKTPNDLPQGAITESLVSFIEDAVKERPSNYLWSHKRWKFKYSDEYKDMVIERTSQAK